MEDTRLSPADLDALRQAHALLENPGLAARITNLIGAPVEKFLDRLPASWNARIGQATRLALSKAADAALFTLTDKPGGVSSNQWHKLGAAATGGAGGFFGLAGLAVELPISTTIMMRSIADIARSEGESLVAPDTRLACLEVFALGGANESDDGAESGYYVVRAALAHAVSQAAEYAGGRIAVEKAAPPALMRLITLVAERFGIQITEKAAAQAIPALGAAGGALINTLFIDHFQDMARGHFIMRRLDRHYGEEAVRLAYESLDQRGKD
ncbi:EcsC family protein [Castellaniella denitrificans]|uniref:EcsC family protein n=1 Tax=Castellaniella denitrificans TaxID=56119 RepID=A0ABT4M4D1_9BURK|nr:EcsC family protein [Castellaniella denitrificans]MCZ4329939.1 EcsC family protein [Castellaniella denitrificans]